MPLSEESRELYNEVLEVHQIADAQSLDLVKDTKEGHFIRAQIVHIIEDIVRGQEANTSVSLPALSRILCGDPEASQLDLSKALESSLRTRLNPASLRNIHEILKINQTATYLVQLPYGFSLRLFLNNLSQVGIQLVVDEQYFTATYPPTQVYQSYVHALLAELNFAQYGASPNADAELAAAQRGAVSEAEKLLSQPDQPAGPTADIRSDAVVAEKV